MQLRVSSPGTDISQTEIDAVERDLEKIARRLDGQKESFARVSINGRGGAPGFVVTLEVDYGATHLVAKEEHADVGQAVRGAREDILRQINDRSPRGHSSFSKGT
ncbi:MAG: hypothetical protein M3345_00935 [Actinomycetota bacterium]|nr:hypothetical protein [Actinomycetota bacterium]